MFKYEPKVSIIIPAYNASNFLREAVDCALNQTYKNIEIIVVNDGSRDNGETEKIALSYDDKIRYLKKENGGSSSALNYGIKNMSGEWFSWLSHDDLYLPNKIYKQIELLNNLDIAHEEFANQVVITGAEFIDKNGKVIKSQSKKQLIKNLKYVNNVRGCNEYLVARICEFNFHGCSYLVNKSAFDKVGLFDETLRLVNDVDFWLRLYKSDCIVHYIPEVLVQGRVHSKQISKSIGFSYHNPEQDKFWAECFDFILSKSNNSVVALKIFAKVAYSKTRFIEGDAAFNKINEIANGKVFVVEIKKFLLKAKARCVSFAKKIYLKVFVR